MGGLGEDPPLENSNFLYLPITKNLPPTHPPAFGRLKYSSDPPPLPPIKFLDPRTQWSNKIGMQFQYTSLNCFLRNTAWK